MGSVPALIASTSTPNDAPRAPIAPLPEGARHALRAVVDTIVAFATSIIGGYLALAVILLIVGAVATNVVGKRLLQQTGDREMLEQWMLRLALAAKPPTGFMRNIVVEGTALPGDRDTKNLYERAGITARKIIVSTRL